MATDIAFALGVLALLGSRVPGGLKVFLTALAIVDDIGAVLVIALCYTDRIQIIPLMTAAASLVSFGFAVRMRIKRVALYAVLVSGIWLGVLMSGIHASVAGILIAMVVPVRSRIQPGRFVSIARDRLAELEASNRSGDARKLSTEQIDVLEHLHDATSDVVPIGRVLERYLHPVTAYFILPLFALFNAGVVVDYRIVEALKNPVGLGVLLGLMLGKQAGVSAASWIIIRSRLAELPAGVTFGQIYGVSILAGIGFTMALFVADLALENEQLLGFSKLGILASSVLCAAAGYSVLRSVLTRAGKQIPIAAKPTQA